MFVRLTPRRFCAPLSAAGLLVAAVGAGVPACAADPNSPEVKAAIEKGVNLLRSRYGGKTRVDSYFQLAALGMAKGGAPKDDPVIVTAIEALRERCKGGYTPDTHHLYSAGIEMMLLEAAGDPEIDREHLRTIHAYVAAQQQEYGAWYYPDDVAKGGTFFGDTSITQYAMLGLWSAERAGLPVDRAAWAGAARWQIGTRLEKGAFAYHPKPGVRNEPRITMTAAGGCNLLLAAKYLYGDEVAAAAAKEEAAAERAEREAADALAAKYNALKRREEQGEIGGADRPADGGDGGGSVPPAANLVAAAVAAADYVGPRLAFDPDQPNRQMREPYYLLYTCERLGALSGKKLFGGVDWYEIGSEWLLATMTEDGAWEGSGRSDVSTAFAIMFLVRSTEKALGKRASLYGGGLLKGGRGLPEDLTKARMNGDELEYEKPTGELSDLLSRLDDPAAANVPAAQEAILESVRTGDREALVGQADRLRRLIDDPRPDVRAVALWALARSGGPGDVGAIYDRLVEDPDAAVAREAHNALCVLARLPRGPEIPASLPGPAEFALNKLADRDLPRTYFFNDRLRVLPAGPFDGLPFDADDAAKAQAFQFWRKVAAETWEAWRDGVRPYEQRDLAPAPKTR